MGGNNLYFDRKVQRTSKFLTSLAICFTACAAGAFAGSLTGFGMGVGKEVG